MPKFFSADNFFEMLANSRELFYILYINIAKNMQIREGKIFNV